MRRVPNVKKLKVISAPGRCCAQEAQRLERRGATCSLKDTTRRPAKGSSLLIRGCSFIQEHGCLVDMCCWCCAPRRCQSRPVWLQITLLATRVEVKIIDSPKLRQHLFKVEEPWNSQDKALDEANHLCKAHGNRPSNKLSRSALSWPPSCLQAQMRTCCFWQLPFREALGNLKAAYVSSIEGLILNDLLHTMLFNDGDEDGKSAHFAADVAVKSQRFSKSEPHPILGSSQLSALEVVQQRSEHPRPFRLVWGEIDRSLIAWNSTRASLEEALNLSVYCVSTAPQSWVAVKKLNLHLNLNHQNMNM